MNYEDLAEPMKVSVDMLAKICHEANKAYCDSIGDTSQKHWDDAPEWQRTSAKNGVVFHLHTPFTSEADSHVSWMKEKVADGWVFGEVKDVDKKEHPCMVDYDKLDQKQRLKDFFFKGIVDSYKKFHGEDVRDFKPFDNSLTVLEHDIKGDKALRNGLDIELQKLKQLPRSRERSLAITKLQESIMWLGMDLKRLNEPNPYPDSYNASNTNIAPTSGGLKL